MRPATYLAPLCLLSAALSGCSRTTDTFAPRIFITSPADGATSQSRTPLVRGYAVDDVGVTRLTVNGKPLAITPGSRKIARFQFQAQVPGGKADYAIHAYDAAGHDSRVTVPLTVDTQPPRISVKAFERAGRTIRVSGVVTDNGEVAQILVDGNRLNITPGKRTEFYAQTTGIYADIVAYDAAGNKSNVRAQR